MQATLAFDRVTVQFFYTTRAGYSFKRSFNIPQATLKSCVSLSKLYQGSSYLLLYCRKVPKLTTLVIFGFSNLLLSLLRRFTTFGGGGGLLLSGG